MPHRINPTTELTTEHSASSYGKPVLVIDGEAYGPADKLPAGHRGLRGGEMVSLWAALPGRSTEERRAARAYCAQWPEGPQVPPEPQAALGALGGAAGRGAAKVRGDSAYMRALSAKAGAKRGRPKKAKP